MQTFNSGGRRLTPESQADLEEHIEACDKTIEAYTAIKEKCEKELAYDKMNDEKGVLVQIRKEIAFQQIELAKQRAYVEQSEKELEHCITNRECNMYAQRGSGFLDLITCGNDVVKVFDTKGSGHLYRIQEQAVYNQGKNHYPNGATTKAMVPGDTTELVINPNGSFEWKQTNGELWHYDINGFLVKIENKYGVALYFNYTNDYYLSSIEGRENGQSFPLAEFIWENNYLVKIENARDRSETVEYAYFDNKLVSVKDTDGDTIQFSYEKDLLTKIIKPENAMVTITYAYDTNEVPYVIETTNEEGFPDYFTYRKAESYLAYTNRSSVTTEYWYDKNHNTTKIKFPNGIIESYFYNENNVRVQTVKDDSQALYTYEAEDQSSAIESGTKATQARSQNYIQPIIEADRSEPYYYYDNKDNLVSVRKGNEEIYSAQYNNKGQMVSARQANVFYQFSYDVFGNLIKRSRGTGAEARVETWIYDNRNRVLTYTNPLGEKTMYEYTEKETKVQYVNGLEESIRYNSRKDLVLLVEKDIQTGRKNETESHYDKRHLLLEKKINGEKIVSFTYKPAGEVESIIDWDCEGGYKQFVTYDIAGRIKEINLFLVDKTGKAQNSDVYTKKIAYNKNTNQQSPPQVETLNKIENQNSLVENFILSPFTFDDDIIRYTYNTNGTLHSTTNVNGILTTYIYNEFGS